MKKIFTYMLAGLSLLLFSRCDALDIDPTSSIADSNYWKTEAQFSTFNVGLHALLRECSFNFFLLGEPRADIYGDVPSEEKQLKVWSVCLSIQSIKRIQE